MISSDATLEAICQALVDAANAAGGPDNITVVLLQFDVA
jgi:serine/threonine protein phosphatase PrpC